MLLITEKQALRLLFEKYSHTVTSGDVPVVSGSEDVVAD